MAGSANTGRRNDFRARGMPGYWAFVVHRLSGVGLALFMPVHFWALSKSLQGEAALDSFLRWTDTALFKFAEWGLVCLLAAHLVGGMRLLLIEFGPWRGLRSGGIVAMLGTTLSVAILLAALMMH
jgi:fumarate reductase subunit D